MVPPVSALSLALCHEALEGGGNHKMEPSTENQHRKKKLPQCKTVGTVFINI